LLSSSPLVPHQVPAPGACERREPVSPLSRFAFRDAFMRFVTPGCRLSLSPLVITPPCRFDKYLRIVENLVWRPGRIRDAGRRFQAGISRSALLQLNPTRIRWRRYRTEVLHASLPGAGELFDGWRRRRPSPGLPFSPPETVPFRAQSSTPLQKGLQEKGIRRARGALSA
jgi:hypothetical protein